MPVPRAPAPPSVIDVWHPSQNTEVHCYIREPWKWVMQNVVQGATLTAVEDVADLPSSKLPKPDLNGGVEMTPGSITPASRRRRAARKKAVAPSTISIELTNRATGEIMFAVHGTSSAFDGLEDKDELVRTMQRCRCEHLNLSPPSTLITWDVTSEECSNLVGKDLPKLEGSASQVAVLKEPMGSEGRGVYFVKTAEEIHKIIHDHHQRVTNEPDYLDQLIAVKGRIPSWVLQAEVTPCLLIDGGKKFHIRTYVVVMEQLHDPDLLEVFVYDRHEVRLAGVAVDPNESERNRFAHITNSALSSKTKRLLLHEVDELMSRGLKEQLDLFVAETFATHFYPDIVRRVQYSSNQEPGHSFVRKFTMAGLDLMVTEDNKIYLLEANVNPSAPTEDMAEGEFRDHLNGFMKDLIDLVVGQRPANFLSARDILQKHGRE